MRFDRPPAAGACLLATLLLAACGGRDAASSKADASADSAAEPVAEASVPGSDSATEAPGSGSASEATTAPLSTADIDRWDRGIAGELEAVRAAAAKLKTAKTGEDTLSAMMGVQEMNTLEAGARAAGVDPERYKVIRSNLSSATGLLTPELGGIDTTILSPAQRAELKQGNESQLKQMEGSVPAEVIAALRPRATELRKKDMELVGARLKGAGM
jgi:hypothetical protein